MFRRIPWEAVIQDARIVGLFLLIVGAVFLVLRLIRMGRKEADARAAMPLDDND